MMPPNVPGGMAPGPMPGPQQGYQPGIGGMGSPSGMPPRRPGGMGFGGEEAPLPQKGLQGGVNPYGYEPVTDAAGGRGGPDPWSHDQWQAERGPVDRGWDGVRPRDDHTGGRDGLFDGDAYVAGPSRQPGSGNSGKAERRVRMG